MVRKFIKEVTLDDKKVVDVYCKSTDTKPVGFAQGSFLLELDTGYIYTYDEAGAQDSEWVKVCELPTGSDGT